MENDLERTIEEIAQELVGLDYKQAEQRMRAGWRLSWLRILEKAQRLVNRPSQAPRQLRQLFRSVSQELQVAAVEARGWMRQYLPEAMRAGLTQADMQFRRQQVRPVSTSFSMVHRDAVEAITRDSMSDLLRATLLTEERIKQRVRAIVKEEVEGQTTSGERATGKRIAERLAEEQIFGITAKNGRFIPMEEYARIVAHTKLRQAHTQGVEQLMADNGYDLVKISSHVHKPDLCTPIEGKVYSLSGRDERFPKLPHHTPFHIGCRHVETPFVDRFYSEAELDEMRAQSRSQTPVQVYSPEQLSKIERKRKKRSLRRAKERIKEQANELNVAKSKKTAAGAAKSEVVASQPGGPRVQVPQIQDGEGVEAIAGLLQKRKVRTSADVMMSLLPPWEQETTGSLLEATGRELSLLPARLRQFWEDELEDYLEINSGDVSLPYAAAYLVSERRAFVDASTWLENPGMVLEEAIHLLDHQLGSTERAFSEGGGRTGEIELLGQSFFSLFESHRNAFGDYAARNSREFLAWSIRRYWEEPNSLPPEVLEFVQNVWQNDVLWTGLLDDQ